MSRVFLAREEALGRDVVVKVLAPELAQAVSAERFAREILMAAGLQAPHIVPVLTAGVMADGLPYYTMPFVRGESLRARLQRGDVPLDEAVAILRGIAEALEHAHGRGLVHRDIKPENVLLSGRTAVVTDFGIAKALSASQAHASGGGASRTLTQFGALLGTPAYMAPEQAAGDPADHRADLYAWGVVAYELLAGAHPFAHRSTLQQVVAAHISETPRDLGEVRPGLPAPLGALVMQTLAKRPAERPADATQLLDALTAVRSGDFRPGDVPRARGAPPAAAREVDRAAPAATESGAATAPRGRARPARRVAAAASVVLLALAIVAGALVWRQRAPDPATPPALAVLPFEHQGDSADAYLTAGVTDEIRAKLAGMRDLVVIARASSMQYRATAKAPAEIAGELGVRYLLTGTVQVSGRADARRVIVRPELVEITANRQPRSRWGQPFDAQGADVLRLQGDIAGQVAAAMPGALEGAAGPRVARAPTSDPMAYEAYLRAQAAWGAGSSYDPTSLRRAITFFEQAVVRDSGMIAAWSGLARAQAVLYNSFPADSLRRASLAAVRRVLALDPGGGEGHAAMGTYLVYVERTPERAYEAYARARAVAPPDADLLVSIAITETVLGRFDDALRTLAGARQLDPRNPRVYRARGMALLRQGALAKSREAADLGLAVAPGSVALIHLRVATHVAAGDLAGARAFVAAAQREAPRERILAALAGTDDLGWALDERDRRALLALDAEPFAGRAQWAVIRSETYASLGDTAQARAWGDSARRIGFPADEAVSQVALGLALAHAGQRADAVAAARRAITLANAPGKSRMSYEGSYVAYAAARAAAIAGDRAQALAWLADARSRRYLASPAWARLDPSFAALRGEPAFDRALRTR